MTTQTTDDTTFDPNSLEGLRAAAARNPEYRAKADAAEDRASKAERELAFLKAGINPDAPGAHPALAGWVNGYNGSLENPEDIRQAAIAASLIAPTPADPAIAAQAAAEGRVQAASVGASLPSSTEGLVAGMVEARTQGGQAGMEAYMDLHGVPRNATTL